MERIKSTITPHPSRRIRIGLLLTLALAVPAVMGLLGSDASNGQSTLTQTPTNTATATPTANCTPLERVVDGTFEAGPPWPAWTQTSTNSVSPFCNIGTCPPEYGPPFSGQNWARFGGVSGPVTTTISQTIPFPSGNYNLWIRLRFAEVSPPYTDTLIVRLDDWVIGGFTEPSAPG
ncbi:MAG: hypothetical protein ACKVRN_12845 [Pyrinomonadaceae bacterium]